MRIEDLSYIIYRGLFYYDDLFPDIALKGGNAIKTFYQEGGLRSSFDLDFSMRSDFPDIVVAEAKLKEYLSDSFDEADLYLFDLKLKETPRMLSDNIRHFWGGYTLEFKFIEKTKKDLTIDQKRREAMKVQGQGKFKIDFSKHEYIEGAEEKDVRDSISLFVYTPAMIVCEKLRAICQQHRDYQPIVNRDGRGTSSRARDFFDIHHLVTNLGVDLRSNEDLLVKIFTQKRVSLDYLKDLDSLKDIHAAGYDQLRETVDAGYPLLSFEEYFDFVKNLIANLDLLK